MELESIGSSVGRVQVVSSLLPLEAGSSFLLPLGLDSQPRRLGPPSRAGHTSREPAKGRAHAQHFPAFIYQGATNLC